MKPDCLPVLLLIASLTCAGLRAQDTRVVTEPVFPPVCAQLTAQLQTGQVSETLFDTARIQSALNSCPPGQAVELQLAGANNAYLIAPIQLPKGATLLIDAGVTVLASRNPRDYDANSSQSCGTLTAANTGCVPLITASHADGAGIMGYGVIDGRGEKPMLINGAPSSMSWWDLANSAVSPLSQNNPRMLQVSNTNVFTLYKITLMNAPNFHVALGTDANVTIWGIRIITPYDARNTDGIDPGYSTNVTITNCYISGCWEEGTLLDGTYKKFGPEQRIPHTGRIKFGTESNGGFRNVTISNCVCEGCQGLALESVDGAILEDITVTNISMRDIISAPIFMRLGDRMRGPDNTPVGTLKRVIISNLVCSNSVSRLGSIISGIAGHEIEDVKISNIQILHQGGGTAEDAAFQPPEYEDMYPEPGMFLGNYRANARTPDGHWIPEGAGRGAAGRGPAAAGAPGGTGGAAAPGPGRGAQAAPAIQHSMPSHGFYVRHVKGIQFDNIEIRTDKEDLRPAFVLENVQDADFFRIKVPHAAGAPLFALHKVSDFVVHMCNDVPDTQLKTVESKTL